MMVTIRVLSGLAALLCLGVARMSYAPDVMWMFVALEAAQAHCKRPETCYKTATSPQARRYTARVGPWFDGWDEDRGQGRR